MATIYEKDPGSLIATPGRTVNSFPSGLIRVDRKYVCTTSSAATHRASLIVGAEVPDGDDTPAIDGLYIHPQPSEVESGDGFTEFQVSAYGRVSTASPDMLLKVRKLSQELEAANTGSVQYSVFEASGTACVKNNDEFSYDSLSLPSDVLTPFDVKLTDASAVGYSFLKIEEVGPPFSANNYYYSQLQRLNDAGYDWNSSIDTGRATLIQQYRATFIKEGSADKLVLFWVYLPVITISSQNVFGRFAEVSFTTVRDNAGFASES